MAPQFDKLPGTPSWFSLTYQSNNELNKKFKREFKPSAKVAIAKILNDNFSIEIHSYLHCNIIFSINTNNPFTEFDKIFSILLKSMDNRLLFNLSLVSKNSSSHPENIMYINGSDNIENNFRRAIA